MYKGMEIESAAIMSAVDGKVHSVPKPGRHHDVIALMVALGYDKPIRGEQGFLTNTGLFVRRVPAKNIAREAGQLLDTEMGHRRLYSEDVW